MACSLNTVLQALSWKRLLVIEDNWSNIVGLGESSWSRGVAATLNWRRIRSVKLFAEYNQLDAYFHNLFISVRRSTCFRWFFRPSSGTQYCTYGVRHLSDRYCYLLLAWLGWNCSSRLAAGGSNGLTNAWRTSSFELLMMDGRAVGNM